MPLKQQIIRAKEDLLDNEDRADIIDCCIWIMKLIVRAGLALVIEKEHRYTRDLYPAYQIFAKHYHEKGAEMKQALQYAIAPVDLHLDSFIYGKEDNEIIAQTDGHGRWFKWLA
ncbi:hypothetical protein [Halalkalibacterium halodurans]|uniref:hypothetical protein n=1 Tax=Halalkalibacterium halodurans TaxID=86665 RepID=UPI002AA98B54|nr:hypothetical protein [Halalkalibacterium halodurans]MDY7224165.1 hypothetical protein [Halalkalibacterium halodurans]MDY7243450.1 hypothetical protein [Halalkalibacterium halodurans]